MEVQKILVGSLLCLMVVLVVAIDIRAWVNDDIGMEGTASHIIHQWIRKWPIIGVVIGVLVAHLVGW